MQWILGVKTYRYANRSPRVVRPHFARGPPDKQTSAFGFSHTRLRWSLPQETRFALVFHPKSQGLCGQNGDIR
ncbi:Uncharacterised protein [Vibrio cholerae]|nr:Uncharacterised protein [Vibrio cholerae]